jgi:hypothetical protein
MRVDITQRHGPEFLPGRREDLNRIVTPDPPHHREWFLPGCDAMVAEFFLKNLKCTRIVRRSRQPSPRFVADALKHTVSLVRGIC